MKTTFTVQQKLILAFCFLALIVKAQSPLNYQWAFNNKNINPQGANVENRGIVKDASGNIYVAGYYSNTADFDPGVGTYYLQSNGNTDIYFAKYNSTGNLVWAKSIGGIGSDQAYGLTADASGNIYITGNFNNTVDFDPNAGAQIRVGAGSGDIYVAKYDPNGNLVFVDAIGAAQTDVGNAITTTTSNIYVTGSFYNTVDFDPSAATQTLAAAGSDIFVLKLDLAGNYVGAINIGGIFSDDGKGIVADANNNVYLTGYFGNTADFDPSAATQTLTSAGGNDIFLAKYDVSLAYVYASRMGGTGSDIGNGLDIDVTGNVYVTGSFNNTADFDPSVATQTITSNGLGDIFYGKYDSFGGYVYAYGIGGTMSDNAYKINVDASLNVYITGPYYSTVDFDASAATQTLTAFSGADIYLAKYDASGNYVYANGFGDIGTDIGFGIYVDATDVYLSGNFGQTVDFDPSVSTNALSAGGSYTNVFFAKYNLSGAYQLASRIGDVGGLGISESAQAVVRDASGNIYVTGQFTGVVDFDPSAATQTLSSVINLSGSATIDIFLAKYDASGNYLWAKSMGGTASDLPFGLKLDAASNVYVTGYFTSTDCDFDASAVTQTLTTNGSGDVFLMKYDVLGNYVYAISFGGVGDDRGLSVTVDASGDAYVAGFFTGTVDFDPSISVTTYTSAGGSDIFFAKYNSTGAFVLAATMGGTNTGTSDQATGIEVDASNNIYVGGYYVGISDFDPSATTFSLASAGSQDVFFAKYSSTGALIFAKSIGGTSGDVCNDMAIDASGNIYVAGYFGNSNSDFDPNAGTQNLTYVGGGGDIYFAKYDATGNYVYAKSIGSSAFEGVNSITVDATGRIYIAGYFNGTVDFDPSAAVVNLVSNGGVDIFIGGYDATGNYIFAAGLGSGVPDVANGIDVSTSGEVVAVGHFNTTVDFDPSASVANLSSSNSQDMFIAKYNVCAAVTSTVTSLTNPLCFGLTTGAATVNASGGSGFTYSWSPSGGTASSATGLSAGNYSVFVQNVCGGSITQTLTITEPAVLTLSASSSNTSAICASQTATLSSFGAGGTGIISYNWISVATNSNTVVNPSVTTVYTITITDANSCSVSSTVSISVNPNPTVTAISSTSVLCTGQQASLTVTGANTYTWNTTSTNTTIVVSPTVNTNYSVTGTDANGCVSTAVITQSVSLCTGINSFTVELNVISVYPNPNNGSFNINVPSINGNTSIEIMNMIGETVYEIKQATRINEINISDLASGIYIVRVKEGSNTISNTKVIKD